MTGPVDTVIDGLDVSAYEIPVDSEDAESDGTLTWDSTTMVVVEVRAGGETGIGYTYGHQAVATLISAKLADVVTGRDPMRVGESWSAMSTAIRNAGRPGVGMMAISAVDIALWDLKAKLVGLAVADLLDAAHETVPVYGSGGFTNYPIDRLTDQVAGWVEQGIPRVKLKVSRRPDEDPARLDAVRKAIGDDVDVYVDGNGALTRKQALSWAQRFRYEWNVSWFEEPVSSDDTEGLRFLRDRGPGGLDIAAGEYGFVLADFRRWLEGGCVDCLQADVTRCGGVTGFLRVSGLCDAHTVDVSGHCAPAVSAHALCGAVHMRHLEYFHDHVRIEGMFFDGTLSPDDGYLRPDRSRAGFGLKFKHPDAETYRIA